MNFPLHRPAGTVLSTLFSLSLAAALPLSAQNNAYVVNSTVNTVTVIDTTTAAIRGTVAVGTSPSQAAVSPNGSRVYVTNRTSNSISVIDATSLAAISTIPTGAGPTFVAVAPNGQRLYVMTAGGVVQVIDAATGALEASVTVGGSGGEIAFTPDGSRAYVATSPLAVIDTAANTVTTTAIYAAGSLVMAPNGQRVYVTTNGTDIFGSTGAVLTVDTATNTVINTFGLGALPGALAITPDGSRLYVGIQAFWVDTGYGAGFFNGRTVTVFDLASSSAGQIDLGAAGNSWNLQNTAGRMAVTPNRGDIYILVPRTSSVAVASVNTNTVRLNIPVGSGPSGVAMTPDPNAVLVPYVIDAVDDLAPTPFSNAGGTAIANVLANDTLGGLRASVRSVTLSQVSSTTTGVSLDTATGAILVTPGAALGTQSIVYRICEMASASNCDQATATLTLRAPYVIDAVDDSTTSTTGRTAIASVLGNDTLNGVAATTATVRVTQVSTTHAGIALNASTGAVTVAAGTPVGPQSLVYRICETASPANCDQAAVSINVIPFVVDAVNDAGTATRTGGLAVANVLANDTFNGTVATLAKVSLALVSTTNAGVTLSLTSGAVNVAAGTAIGSHSLVYRICEIASPANCDSATVTVNVTAYVIDAVNDTARGSSKAANTALASVLTNDRLGGVRPTTAAVQITQLSLTPANSMIRLDTTDGSVDVLGKTNSGLYSLVYRICEIANPSNCDQATVSLDLSGK